MKVTITYKNKKKVQRYTGGAKGQEDSVCYKKIVTIWKKAAKKIITSSASKNIAKNLANKVLDKAPDMIDSLNNITNNKIIKKVLNANITEATVNKDCVKNVQTRSHSWSVFSCIRTGYGDLLSKSPYSV